MYKEISELWEYQFNVDETGIFMVHVSATCRQGKILGLWGGEDLRVEIDGIKFEGIPLKDKPQYYNIPAAWNGSDLRGTEKTVIFVLNLNQGSHSIRFIPKRGAKILKEPQIIKFDGKFSSSVLKNVQSEEKDRQPWVTMAVIDLPVNFFDTEFTCKKRTAFDSDDVKLVIDGKIQKNSNSGWWGKNWFWQGKVLQGKTQLNRFYVDLPKGVHYIEFWADREPLLNSLSLDISEENGKSDDNDNSKVFLRTYKVGLLGEDYNRLDSIILEIVGKWNDEFSDDIYPVENLLDPNLVKAMIYQESKMGYHPGGEINVMQVGNPGDPSLKTLNGELTEYWMKNGKEIKLDYKGEAKASSQYDSIYWGVRWLYHKAQGTKNGRRYWREWKDAVQSYGPGPKKYIENVWSIYKNGIDKLNPSEEIKLWSIIFLVPLIFNWHGFLFQLNNFTAVDAIKNKILVEERAKSVYIENIEVVFSETDPDSFFSITEWEKDWWEKLRIGKLKDGNVQWLNIDNPVEQQYILSAKFVQLRGFDRQILEVYGKTHVGNGFLYLYEIDSNQARLILETHAVDSKNELSTKLENLNKYGYWQCDEVFRNGQLESEYKDLNNDGVDDVILNGISDTICEKEINDNIVVETNKIKKVFLWDKAKGTYKEMGQ